MDAAAAVGSGVLESLTLAVWRKRTQGRALIDSIEVLGRSSWLFESFLAGQTTASRQSGHKAPVRVTQTDYRGTDARTRWHLLGTTWTDSSGKASMHSAIRQPRISNLQCVAAGNVFSPVPASRCQ